LYSRRRANFYEAGSGQEVIRFDWFTLLFEVIQLDSLAIIIVEASLNWCDEAHSPATRFTLKLTRELFVISIIPNLLTDHSTNTFACYQANQCWSAKAREFDDAA
jgi:hypothetical protein